MLAVEIVRAAWRLHRCVIVEAEDGNSVATQAAVDRARALAHNSLRRLLHDLHQFQSDRWLRAEVLRDGFDAQHIGIADAHRVIKGLAGNERLKSQFFAAPVPPAVSAAGANRTQPPSPQSQVPRQAVGQASRPVEPPIAPTIRTQSANSVAEALSTGNQSANSSPPFYSTPNASSTLPELAPTTA